MLIGLLDLDNHELCKINNYRHSIFPNIALMKFSSYYKLLGHSVEMYSQLNTYDLVLVSKIFDNSFTRDYPYNINSKKIIYGGTGYGVNTVDWIEDFDSIMPDYDLYQTNHIAYGFLTRGCPRCCEFCIVSKIEGRAVKQVANLIDFVDERHTVVKICDPNILAHPNHLQLLEELAKSGLEIDFNQGIDIRLINEKNIEVLKKINVRRYHFAWDNPEEDLSSKFKFVSKHLHNKNKTNYSMLAVYVLVNFNSTIEQDLRRIYLLKELGFSPFVMVYNKSTAPKDIKRLQRYVNSKQAFRSKDCKSFDDYCA